jgi:predicted DNA binding CopG/RHH family protein
MKLDADEKELFESVERGEWKPAHGGKRERTRYARYAKATFRKDRRLNIRLSSKDLEAIQKRALAEDLPYQTLIASLLHKYASGRLRKSRTAGVSQCPMRASRRIDGGRPQTHVRDGEHRAPQTHRCKAVSRRGRYARDICKFLHLSDLFYSCSVATALRLCAPCRWRACGSSQPCC